jgi:hypothetical protein
MGGSTMTDVPETHHWLAGDAMNADRMNEVRDAIEWLRNPPMVHVRRRLTTQSLPGNQWNKIVFDQIANSYDPYGMFDTGATDRITATVPGWYSYEGVLAINGTATVARMILGVYKNGFTTNELMLRYDVDNAPSSGNMLVRKESTIFLNVGDWLHLAWNLNAAETRTSQITSDSESSQLRVRWVSK